MSDNKAGFLVTINPAVAYRWIRNTNSYKLSELQSKTVYKTLKRYGLDKKGLGDIMIWIIAFAAVVIIGYIAVQLFSGHGGETIKNAAQTIAKNVTVVHG